MPSQEPTTIESIDLLQELLTNLKAKVILYNAREASKDDKDSILKLISVYRRWAMPSVLEAQLDSVPEQNRSFSATIFALREEILLSKGDEQP